MSNPDPRQPDIAHKNVFDDDEQPYDVLEAPKITVEDPWQPPLPMNRGKPCPACGYDLRGSRSDVCPECGAYYQEALEEMQERVEHWIDIFSFRWLLYGLLPMFIWAVPAWLTFKFGNSLAYGLATMSGLAGVFICASWAAVKANEELELVSGLFLSITIFVGVVMTNLAVMGFVMMIA